MVQIQKQWYRRCVKFFSFFHSLWTYYPVTWRQLAEVSLNDRAVPSFQKDRFILRTFISSGCTFRRKHRQCLFLRNLHFSFVWKRARTNWTTTYVAIQLSSTINSRKCYLNSDSAKLKIVSSFYHSKVQALNYKSSNS